MPFSYLAPHLAPVNLDSNHDDYLFESGFIPSGPIYMLSSQRSSRTLFFRGGWIASIIAPLCNWPRPSSIFSTEPNFSVRYFNILPFVLIPTLSSIHHYLYQVLRGSRMYQLFILDVMVALSGKENGLWFFRSPSLPLCIQQLSGYSKTYYFCLRNLDYFPIPSL